MEWQDPPELEAELVLTVIELGSSTCQVLEAESIDALRRHTCAANPFVVFDIAVTGRGTQQLTYCESALTYLPCCVQVNPAIM